METAFAQDKHRRPENFAEQLLAGIGQTMEHAQDAARQAECPGLLQGLDPRIKLAGLLCLILTSVFVHSLLALAGLFGLALGLALTSRIPLKRLLPLWLSVACFTGLMALPALFLVPGEVLAHLPGLGWNISAQGLRSAAFLLGRAGTSSTLALLLILSTPWPHVLKALRCLGVPVVLVVILGMTQRYLFLFLHTAQQLFEARQSRLMGKLDGRTRRQLTLSGIGVLLSRALDLGHEVHLAMVARGYRGEVHLLDDFHTRPRDWLFLTALIPTVLAAFSCQFLALP